MTMDEMNWNNEESSTSGCSTSFQLEALGTNDGNGDGDNRSGHGHGHSGGNDADSVFYVRLSDMLSVFKFRTPTTGGGSGGGSLSEAIFDSSSDIQYYVFRKCWPTSLKINPSHAMLDQNDSSGMLTDGGGGGFAANKSLVKHDFIRYISLHLFNTIHGVDFLSNETDLLENITYYGEVARVGIMSVLDTVGTLSADITMAADVSGNRYLTNTATGNTNISRELLRQISIAVPERLNSISDAGGGGGSLLSVPLQENDTLNIKIVMEASPGQHTLTNVAAIPARSYNIKLIMKNTVGGGGGSNNTPVIDSDYFPNGYPYTINIQDISASNLSAAASVYADGSPPVPIPLIRYGYQGWYYTNSNAWVNPAPMTRNKINWYVLPNTATTATGVTTVGNLRYFRMNLHLFTNASLPFVTVYTQATGSGDAGGWYKSKRVYVCSSGVDDDGNTVSDHTNYSFYMNWNGYSVAPFTVAHTAAALSVSGEDGSVVGGFESSEVIFAYSIGTNSNSNPGDVEFILSSVVVGEAVGGGSGGGSLLEKEYGYIM
jgi:hypothetical protein